MRSTTVSLIALSVLALSACGGGEGSEKTPPASASVMPTDTAIASSPASGPASAPEASATAAASATQDHVNAAPNAGATVKPGNVTPSMSATRSGTTMPAGVGEKSAPTPVVILGTPPASDTNTMPTSSDVGLPDLPDEPLAKATATTTVSTPTNTAATTTAPFVALGSWVTTTTTKLNTAGRSATAASTAPAGISTTDLVARVAAGTASPQAAIGLQCQGTNSDLSASSAAYAVPEGTATPVQRFGQATVGADPVYRLEVGNTDKLAVGAPPRCENLVFPSATTGIKQGELFWHAIEIWADDWSNTSDDQLILQWHQNDPRLSLNPMLAFVLRGNQLRAEMLTSPANPATRATYVAASSVLSGWKPRQWNTLVIQGRISPSSAQAPLLRIWLNNQLVVDRNQPIGFQLQAGSYNYVKWGIYKWTNGNPWNPLYAKRAVMVRNMLLVRDPRAGYTNSTISTALTAQVKTQ